MTRLISMIKNKINIISVAVQQKFQKKLLTINIYLFTQQQMLKIKEVLHIEY